jgi:non-specific serine/threonine protein kinase
LTPHGRLVLLPADDAIELEPGLARRLQDAFARGAGHGLLHLGAAEVGHALPPVFSYWRELGTRYVTAVCTQPEVAAHSAKLHVPIPADEQLEQLVAAAPLMPGSEYLTVHVLRALWQELDAAFRSDLSAAAMPLQEFLRRLNQAWNLVGRVHFNLAENRSMRTDELCGPPGPLRSCPHGLIALELRITVGVRSAAISRSGGRNFPGRSAGGVIAASASSFSVGSACK